MTYRNDASIALQQTPAETARSVARNGQQVVSIAVLDICLPMSGSRL